MTSPHSLELWAKGICKKFSQCINFEWAHANKTAPYEIVCDVETQITLVCGYFQPDPTSEIIMAASPFRRHIDTSYTPFEVFKELPRGFERVLECSRGGVGFWGDS